MSDCARDYIIGLLILFLWFSFAVILEIHHRQESKKNEMTVEEFKDVVRNQYISGYMTGYEAAKRGE